LWKNHHNGKTTMDVYLYAWSNPLLVMSFLVTTTCGVDKIAPAVTEVDTIAETLKYLS